MKAATLFLTSALVLLACVSNLAAQDRYFLDLTRARELAQPARIGFGCGPRLTGGDHGELVQPTAPLTLEVVSFDKSTYTLGEDMVCQVRLTNVGIKPIRIPWSPNSDFGNKDCTGGLKDATKASLTGSLALFLVSDSGVKRRVPLESLYGRLSIPETFRVLDPGEAAGIKLRERLVLSSASPREPSGHNLDLPQNFVVMATYDLDDTSMGNPYATVSCKNRVKVKVEMVPTRGN